MQHQVIGVVSWISRINNSPNKNTLVSGKVRKYAIDEIEMCHENSWNGAKIIDKPLKYKLK